MSTFVGIDIDVLNNGRAILVSLSSPELDGELDEKMLNELLLFAFVLFDSPFCSSYH